MQPMLIAQTYVKCLVLLQGPQELPHQVSCDLLVWHSLPYIGKSLIFPLVLKAVSSTLYARVDVALGLASVDMAPTPIMGDKWAGFQVCGEIGLVVARV